MTSSIRPRSKFNIVLEQFAHTFNLPTYKLINRMIDDGYSQAEIARTLGVHPVRVSQIVKKARRSI